MEEFELKHIDDYTIEQLADFVIAGKTTVQELYDEGLFRPLRSQLLKELEVRDNIAWKEAVVNGSIDAIDGYIAVFNQPSPHYHGNHVEEAKELKAQIEQAADTRDAKPENTDSFESAESFDVDVDETTGVSVDNVSDTDNKDSENTTDGKIDSFEHASAQQENSVTGETEIHGIERTEGSSKNIKKWGLICLIAVILVILISFLLHFINEKEEAVPLTQDDITEIIKNYQDSLKTDIFDGFYLIPAVWDGISRNYPLPLPGEEGFNENIIHPTYSADDSIQAYIPQDVIALFKGRFDVINNNGSIMPLPGVSDGIDSLLVVNKPFIEYIDDNGIRRVVALLNNDLYYYAGYCGTHDGFRQYVLINRAGKYGLVDENGTIIKDFFNEEIVPSSSNYYIKNGSAKQYYNFAGNAIEESSAASTQNSNKLKVDYSQDRFMDQSGKVIASFDEITFSDYKGRYKVKGTGGYGIYNATQRKVEVPLRYEDISVYGAETDLFPAKKNGKWGYVRSGGAEAIGFRFKAAYSFDPDTKLACVKEDGGDNKCGYIDMSGAYKIQPQYYSAGTLTPDGARVMRSSSEYGYITKSGSLIASWYPYMSSRFVLDRIFVKNNDKLGGFIDKNNRLVIPYQFEETASDPIFSEVTHLAKVRFKGMDWYVNTNGAFSIPVCIYVDEIDKKRSREWNDRHNRKGAARKKVAKDVVPTEQSIPELMLKIAEISEQTSQEIANEENNSKSKEKQYKK
ncbi:MAG: WG repeat-containing protein [Muribaculaceae bacterium]|nr:WG repeat-containing protein [Muribaculaceae bacterium]